MEANVMSEMRWAQGGSLRNTSGYRELSANPAGTGSERFFGSSFGFVLFVSVRPAVTGFKRMFYCLLNWV